MPSAIREHPRDPAEGYGGSAGGAQEVIQKVVQRAIARTLGVAKGAEVVEGYKVPNDVAGNVRSNAERMAPLGDVTVSWN